MIRITIFVVVSAAAIAGMRWALRWISKYGIGGGTPDKIAKGSTCTWWNRPSRAQHFKRGEKGYSYAGCPHCECEVQLIDEDKFWAEVDAQGPRYRKMIERSRGQCFPSWAELADHLVLGTSPFSTWRS